MMDCSTNNTTSNHHPTKTPSMVIVVIYPIHIFLTLFSNGLVFWLVYKNHRLRSPQNMILVSLCVVDILYIIVFISKMLRRLSTDYMTSQFCFLSSQLYKWLVIFTKVHLIIISIDRLVAIKHPLRYLTWVTKKRAIVFFTLLWLVYISTNVVTMSRIIEEGAEGKRFWKGMANCHRHKDRTHHDRSKVIVLSCLLAFVPLVIIVTCYVIAFRIAWKQVKQIFPLTEHQARRKSAIKAARTTAILIGTFFVLYTPSHIHVVLHILNEDSWCQRRTIRHLRQVLYFLTMSAAWINPLVYTLTNADFKEAFKKLLNSRPIPHTV